MSSLHDPFELIKTGQEMDNVVPFLAPNKVNQMISAALAQPQMAAQKPALTSWKYGGLAIAASLALFMVFLSPAQTPTLDGEQTSLPKPQLQMKMSANLVNWSCWKTGKDFN
jgi:hypothetical protein